VLGLASMALGLVYRASSLTREELVAQLNGSRAKKIVTDFEAYRRALLSTEPPRLYYCPITLAAVGMTLRREGS
jgi:hypothetical protein